MAIRDQLRALLAPYGLEELVDAAVERFLDGVVSGPELELWLEEQPVVQQRFAAVFERRRLGLPPISFLDVVEYERRARELATMYGIDPDFIDVNRLMVADVSINELGARVQEHADVVANRPDVVEQLSNLYGLSPGDALMFVLDPDTGLPAVQRRWQSARVAAQAQRQGFGQLTAEEAESLFERGVSEKEASEGFGLLGAMRQVTGRLEGESTDAMSRAQQLAAISGDQQALTELQRRARRRTSVFEETSGTALSNEGVIGAGTAR